MAESASVKWLSARPWLGTVIRIGLGVIWIWAALPKISSPRTFVQAVRAYDVTPEWLSKGIGYGLPILELCIGIALILGIATRVAAIASGLLFLVFLVGIIQAAARGIQLECGCFGGGGTTTGGTSYTLDILRDIGLLALAAFLIVWPLTRISMDEYIARNDRVEQPSAKRMRNDQARKKYNALLESRRKEARSRNAWIAGSLAAVVVLVSLIGIGVQSGRAKIEGSLTAANASVKTGIVYGKKAAATVDVYEDFQCPICGEYERSVGETMRALVAANKAQVRYHMLSLASLDTAEDNYYSSRAANAGYCASDVSDDYFVAFHSYFYKSSVQPAEGAGGLSNDKIESEAAKITGVKALTATQKTDFASCVDTNRHKALVQAITDKSSQDGITGTPTVKVNGKKIENTAAALTKAVNEAGADGPAPSPSPSSATASTPASTAPKPSTTATKAP